LENNLETKLIYGLSLAGTKQTQEAESMARALMESSSWGEKKREAGTWIFAMQFFYSNHWHHNMFRLLSTRESRTLRPASRYLDAGLVFENRSTWNNAQLFYEQSITALPLEKTTGLNTVVGSPPLPDNKSVAMPFCIAFDRHFVTGSWYAFAEYAFERFQSAVSEDSRQHWALATIEAASVTLRKYSDRPWARQWRGLAQVQNGRYDLAEVDLERALIVFRARELNTAEILTGLGYVKIQREDLPAAENYLQQAVAVDPNLAQAWSYLGYCLVQIKDLSRAKHALDRALELDAGLTAAWYNRGLMHFHAHDWTAAVQDLEEAARLSPDIPDIPELLQRARLAERQAHEATESP
jgi:tetratricopeptide (TPR) repeat protein